MIFSLNNITPALAFLAQIEKKFPCTDSKCRKGRNRYFLAMFLVLRFPGLYLKVWTSKVEGKWRWSLEVIEIHFYTKPFWPLPGVASKSRIRPFLMKLFPCSKRRFLERALAGNKMSMVPALQHSVCRGNWRILCLCRHRDNEWYLSLSLNTSRELISQFWWSLSSPSSQHLR